MGHSCNHHHHGHNHGNDVGGTRLTWAIVVNIALTVVQVLAGVISGSLALVADALHNLSDAASLVIALAAHKIARRPADKGNTFGYRRAEMLGALINFTTLVLLGGYLCFEGVERFLDPKPIDGMIVIVVATFALVIDLVTVWLTMKMARDSLNIRAAFLHNISDAMASVAVIVSGFASLYFEFYRLDAVLTFMIAAYVMWHGLASIPLVIRVLMQAAPANVNLDDIVQRLEQVEGVDNIHHVHLWMLSERDVSFEAHVATGVSTLEALEALKHTLKTILEKEFNIAHTTLEMEAIAHAHCDEKDVVATH